MGENNIVSGMEAIWRNRDVGGADSSRLQKRGKSGFDLSYALARAAANDVMPAKDEGSKREISFPILINSGFESVLEQGVGRILGGGIRVGGLRIPQDARRLCCCSPQASMSFMSFSLSYEMYKLKIYTAGMVQSGIDRFSFSLQVSMKRVAVWKSSNEDGFCLPQPFRLPCAEYEVWDETSFSLLGRRSGQGVIRLYGQNAPLCLPQIDYSQKQNDLKDEPGGGLKSAPDE